MLCLIRLRVQGLTLVLEAHINEENFILPGIGICNHIQAVFGEEQYESEKSVGNSFVLVSCEE